MHQQAALGFPLFAGCNAFVGGEPADNFSLRCNSRKYPGCVKTLCFKVEFILAL